MQNHYKIIPKSLYIERAARRSVGMLRGRALDIRTGIDSASWSRGNANHNQAVVPSKENRVGLAGGPASVQQHFAELAFKIGLKEANAWLATAGKRTSPESQDGATRSPSPPYFNPLDAAVPSPPWMSEAESLRLRLQWERDNQGALPWELAQPDDEWECLVWGHQRQELYEWTFSFCTVSLS
jgi:hypothetical protein